METNSTVRTIPTNRKVKSSHIVARHISITWHKKCLVLAKDGLRMIKAVQNAVSKFNTFFLRLRRKGTL